MSILHMETDMVRSAADQQLSSIENIREQMQTVYNAVHNLDWQGPARDQFEAVFADLYFQLFNLLDRGDDLARILHAEVSEWEQISVSIEVALGQSGLPANSQQSLVEQFGDWGIAAPMTASASLTVANTTLPKRTPPPRIYIMNGINSRNSDHMPDQRAMDMENLLESHDYAPEDVVVLNALYNDNKNPDTDTIDWWGVFETNSEFWMGKHGWETKKAYENILADIRENPLGDAYISETGELVEPQPIVLIGHSGGGAPAANLASLLQEQGYKVEGVVTMGSPLVPEFRVPQDTSLVRIADEKDYLAKVGVVLERSSDFFRPFLPGAQSQSTEVTHRTTSSGESNPIIAHGTYYGSHQVLRILQEEFPSISEKLKE